MNKVIETDKTDYELALGTGLMGGAYTIKEAELVAEQQGLDWERVKFWARLNDSINGESRN